MKDTLKDRIDFLFNELVREKESYHFIIIDLEKESLDDYIPNENPHDLYVYFTV